MSDSYDRIKSIATNALELDNAADRSAYLEEACGPDTLLRERIEEFLSSENVADSDFHTGPTNEFESAHFARTEITKDLPGNESKEYVGKMIGRYKLLQQIGEGGMGTVFMAEQQIPVRRKVALKVIKPGKNSEQVSARFEAERQALALMDHENIARVYDAGTTESGNPYFVMELVHGIPVTEYCDQAKLSPKDRLKLFVPICQAIQHAHQKGIIHRDIKPSNVLVTQYDGHPVPKVIDFGVAKATQQPLTERTLFTQFGQIVGTLEYMSPEQAELNQLDVDTRSDVYSLGVLLYELLTGSTPLRGQNLDSTSLPEILRQIREEEPEKPSTRINASKESLPTISSQRQTEPRKLTSLVRGDLDWIVMKALEKDRSRRYQAPRDLSADVNRYLADEPVEASPPTAWYRFQKFARKNRVAISSAAAIVTILILGLVVSSWQAARAMRAEAIAGKSLQEKAKALKESEHSRQQAESISNFLVSAFRTSEPNEKASKMTVVEMLDKAVQNLEGQFPNHPIAKAELFSAFGQAYVGLGSSTKGIRLQERALKLISDNSPANNPDLRKLRLQIADAYELRGRAGDSQKANAYRDLSKVIN